MDIKKEYKDFCESKRISFEIEGSVSPYDNTTLFCPAGMQKFKDKFDSDYVGTISNIQPCIRVNDIDEIGDGSHLLYFNMMGLFSFRKMSLKESIDFWVEFLNKIGVEIHYVTIHPDKIVEWSKYYLEYGFEIKEDIDCIWSDGVIGGYCTEFYHNDIEIGNIVNTMGDCIDVGFGLERLDSIVNSNNKSKQEILKETIEKILDSGYYPSNKEQGYVLRKLLRTLCKTGFEWDNEFYLKELKRQQKTISKYNKLKNKHKDKSKEWWFSTHGIDITEFNN